MDKQILKITDSVEWIGVLDKEITTFDIVMETKYGTTYNSYFINAEKKTIVETVKEKFWDVYEAKLRQLCDPAEIEYIIVNHTEPDHAGGLRKLLKIAPNAKILGSTSALRFLKDQIGEDFPQQAVRGGDIIDLGNKTIEVISAPNLHWPDSIYTYLKEDKVLFTCDSFGAHFCHDDMYINKVGNCDDAYQYYFDVILKPFSKFFLQAIERIRPLEIEAICTGHGPLITEGCQEIIDKTEKMCQEYMAQYPVKNRILIAYVSAYGFTKTIAEKIAEGAAEVPGVEIDLCDIEKMDQETLADKSAKASAYLLGSPTINQNMLPQLYQVFAHMTPIRDKDKPAGCFGSYGWSGEAEKQLIGNIENLKLNYWKNSLFLKFRPQEKDFERIKTYGKNFALIVSGC